MTELTKQCLALSRKERARLAKILQASVDRPDPTDTKRFNELLRIVEQMLGKGIISPSKSYNLCLGRRMIAYQMVAEGYSYSSIGRMMNRSHATVMYMCNMMDDAIKFYFRPDITLWNRFKETLNNYDKTTEIQSDSRRDS